MSISGIGKSGVEEFVQTISQSVVTSELTATTSDYIKDIQNEVLKDADEVSQDPLNFDVLEKRIQYLTTEYQQNILKAVRAFYEK